MVLVPTLVEEGNNCMWFLCFGKFINFLIELYVCMRSNIVYCAIRSLGFFSPFLVCWCFI